VLFFFSVLSPVGGKFSYQKKKKKCSGQLKSEMDLGVYGGVRKLFANKQTRNTDTAA